MKLINVPVPENLSDEDVEVIQDWFASKNDRDWEIFKQNFNAFINSLKQVCKNFWSKICDWASRIWKSIF